MKKNWNDFEMILKWLPRNGKISNKQELLTLENNKCKQFLETF